MWSVWLYIGTGGAMGAMARYSVTLVVNRWSPTLGLPLGTLSVNVVGSFFFAFLIVWLTRLGPSGDSAKLLLLTGFMGSFTTFSTFSYETMMLVQVGHWSMALFNIVLNVAACLTAIALGFWTYRLVGS